MRYSFIFLSSFFILLVTSYSYCADYNLLIQKGYTPLMIASVQGNSAEVIRLLGLNHDPNVRTQYGKASAVDFAILALNKEGIKPLQVWNRYTILTALFNVGADAQGASRLLRLDSEVRKQYPDVVKLIESSENSSKQKNSVPQLPKLDTQKKVQVQEKSQEVCCRVS